MRMGCEIPEIRRGHRIILKGQALGFPRGVTSVLGVNGAGKTTLFSSILGLLHPMARSAIDSGQASPIVSSNRAQFMAAVGYLPQDIPSPRSMTAFDFVSYAAWLKRIVPEGSDVVRCLSRVNLDKDADKPMAKLSGGMRRRAGIAAALVHDPPVLILDEPTAGLDPVERRRLHRLVMSLAQRRVVIVSTHLLEDARAMNGRICVLGAGVVTQVDTASGEISDEELIDVMQGGTE